MNLNLEKYGFEKEPNPWAVDMELYRLYTKGYIVEIRYFPGSRYSIFIKVHAFQLERCIAEDYRCETQEQLDFLLKNGAAEYLL